jgi:hypothetical protein
MEKKKISNQAELDALLTEAKPDEYGFIQLENYTFENVSFYNKIFFQIAISMVIKC